MLSYQPKMHYQLRSKRVSQFIRGFQDYIFRTQGRRSDFGHLPLIVTCG